MNNEYKEKSTKEIFDLLDGEIGHIECDYLKVDLLLDCVKERAEEAERLQKEIKGLNAELELYKDNQIHLNNQLEQKDKIINEVLEYLDISNISFVDKNEIAIRLKGSDKE